ncbi:vertnin [Pelobates cultripes]|uniref:Vertnin n=1 Tax=Pelobates cultripes TaxID=61616 RepID=A0AAD1WUC2_PELCU|nr:vertnin [Pelobates cultripes]
MTSRQLLVQSLLHDLQDAANDCNMDNLINAAYKSDRILRSLSLPRSCMRQFQGELEVDSNALSLYPGDGPRKMLPLKCSGPGNRLFEAASVLLCGHERLAPELQVRTVIEMLLQKSFYLREMADCEVMLQAARYALSTDDCADLKHLPVHVLCAMYDADIRASCFPGTFSNMWHLYALASVLQVNICSIYPLRNQSIRPYFNRSIRPRCGAPDPPTLHIMWSGQTLPPSGFRPHCFVPLVGLEDVDESPTVETLQMLHWDPRLTYSHLHQKYGVTKSTLYRWKRQSHEYRERAITRHEAKRYLQYCFQKTQSMVALADLRRLFPNISRTTYYAWKNELVQGSVSSPFLSPPNTPEGGDHPGSTAGILGEKQSYGESCTFLNNVTQCQILRQSVADISQLNFNMWRKKVFKCSTKSQNLKHPQGVTLHYRAWKKYFHRQTTRRKVMEQRMPYCHFRQRYPNISGSTYSFWRAAGRTARGTLPAKPPSPELSESMSVAALLVPESRVQKSLHNAPGTAHLKAEAKLFLQKRYKAQNFPSFRECQALYPTTARSTYYMWKRALHNGLSLINP